MTTTPALFVTAEKYLRAAGPPGGVQLCTREYLDTVRLAGFDARELTYGVDRRPLTRLRRLVRRRPYADLLPPDLADRVVGAAAGASAVFLNQVDLTPLAAELRRRLPASCRLVLLSHGTESVDALHLLRTRVAGEPFAGVTRREQRSLGESLIAEASFRPHLDAVVCLAPFEAEVERWLGSRHVTWLPRTVPPGPLDWRPVPGRVGFVGTLNHPPNREGLLLFLDALARRLGRGPSGEAGEVRVRLVGGRTEAAEGLARRYPWVEYLGPLPDAELRREASTWAAFCHPLFCYARGCSTKLAVGIGWGVPVLTTPPGRRGYEWSRGDLAVAETPDGLAELALGSTDLAACAELRRGVQEVAASAPTLAEVARRLREFLETVAPAASDGVGRRAEVAA